MSTTGTNTVALKRIIAVTTAIEGIETTAGMITRLIGKMTEEARGASGLKREPVRDVNRKYASRTVPPIVNRKFVRKSAQPIAGLK